MKKILFVIFAGLLAFNAKAQRLESYFHYAPFNSPEGAYVETYLSTIGNSAVFKATENGFQSEIQVTILFKQQDTIRTFEKYVLKSPVIKNEDDPKPNFLDQQRISIKPGIYNFELVIKDLNAEDNQFKINDIININFPENMLSFSGIQILEDYYESTEESILTKNDIDLIPYVSNFFPGNINSIKFYTELYNSKKVIDDDFLIRYYIKEDESGKTIPNIARFKRMSAENYMPILGELNIESLPSGNYQLVIEVLDKDNKKRKEVSYFFQRSKPLNPIDFEKLETFEMNQMFAGNMEHPDSLTLYIESLRPIANEREKQFIDRKIETSDVKIKQRFFYSFWYDRNPGDPGVDWAVYYKQVKLADKLFGTRIKKGFEADRGRVFLAYGSPDDTYRSGHEPSAYPYEIWSFYKIENQRNKKFVFYNPNLAGDDYELLHSNLRGELQTPNWDRYLNKRNNDLYNQDVMQSDSQWGTRALEYYNSH